MLGVYLAVDLAAIWAQPLAFWWHRLLCSILCRHKCIEICLNSKTANSELNPYVSALMSAENGAYKPSCVFDIVHAVLYSSSNW